MCDTIQSVSIAGATPSTLDRFGRDTKRRKFLFYVMLSQATREKDSITTNKVQVVTDEVTHVTKTGDDNVCSTAPY